jgi:hypothetical protein
MQSSMLARATIDWEMAEPSSRPQEFHSHLLASSTATHDWSCHLPHQLTGTQCVL